MIFKEFMWKKEQYKVSQETYLKEFHVGILDFHKKNCKPLDCKCEKLILVDVLDEY